MNIHNLFSDLMLGLANHVNSLLPTKIKHFQFNLANVSFNLGLSPQFELPSAIINLGSMNPYVNHPYVFQANLKNQHQFPVLYNETKDIELIIQEEHYLTNIDFLINCESQIQALNINHILMNFLPLNKYLHLFKFVSFFEINSIFLNRILFNTEKDKIYNLFLKHNKYSNNLDYCFSIQYEPLVKLTSSSVDLTNITASSFQVATSFEILNQLPIYIFGPPIDYSSNVDLVTKKIYHSNIPVAISKELFLILELQHKQTGYIESQLVPINYLTDGTFVINLSYGNISGRLEIERTVYSCDVIYDNSVYATKITKEYNFVTNTSKYFCSGSFSGQLKNVTVIEDDIEAWLTGYFNNKQINEKLKFNITNKYIEYTLQTFVANFFDYQTLNFLLVYNNYNKIPDFILKINEYSVRIDLDNSTIYAVLIFDKLLSEYKSIELTDLYKSRGILEFIYNTKIYSFNFNIDPDTAIISCSQLLPDSNEIEVIAVNFNKLTFNYIAGLHEGIVDSLTLDFNYNNELISSITPFENYSVLLNEYVNIVLDELKTTYDELNRRYYLDINLNNEFKFDYNNFKWKFIINDLKLSSEDQLQSIIVDIDYSDDKNVRFIVTEKLFMSFFVKVDKFNPVFCLFN
jgi:hypothetical protein